MPDPDRPHEHTWKKLMADSKNEGRNEGKIEGKAEPKPRAPRAPKSDAGRAEPAKAEPKRAEAPALGGLEMPVAAPVAPAPEAGGRPVPVAQAPKGGWWWGTGRRKRAVARVRLRPAKGEAKVVVACRNKKIKTIEQYFTEDRDRASVYSPLKATGVLGKIDVVVRVSGGGYMGQAGAIMLGVARALKGYDPNMDATLRAGGFLTRDAREVERKKYGQAGARRRFQFSKR
jgi:small subunit ribosomal protein S9